MTLGQDKLDLVPDFKPLSIVDEMRVGQFPRPAAATNEVLLTSRRKNFSMNGVLNADEIPGV